MPTPFDQSSLPQTFCFFDAPLLDAPPLTGALALPPKLPNDIELGAKVAVWFGVP